MTEVIQFRKPATLEFHEEKASDVLAKNIWPMTVALLVSLSVHLIFFGDYYFTFDDAYVFHVYARNVATGNGFSFNPGEISHAATPLLTFLLALQHFLLGDGALVSGKIMNLFLSLGCVVLLFLIAHRISNSSLIAFGSALVWAASPLESMLAAGPQDFTLFTFLILLSTYTYLFHPQSLWTYAFLSLAILARYEGALFAGLMFLNHAYNDARKKDLHWPKLAARLAVMALLPVLWFAYIGSHSTLLPSSGSAKLNPWALRKIPHFIGGVAIFFFAPILAAAVVSALSNLRERLPSLMCLFIWVSFCLFFYGPFLDNRRYYVHLIPFIAMFALMYLKSSTEKYFHSARLGQIFLVATAALSFIGTFGSSLYFYQKNHAENQMSAYPAYKDAGLWLQKYTPEKATFATEEIGVIPYFAKRKVVDYSGWLDLASKEFREKGDGLNPKMLNYLAGKRPDFLIINTDILTKLRQDMVASDPRFTLVHRIPVLEKDSLLIYACKW